jgi:hypothetical protein
MWLQSRNTREEGKIMLDLSNSTLSWITNNAKIKEYLYSLQKERGRVIESGVPQYRFGQQLSLHLLHGLARLLSELWQPHGALPNLD